VNAGGVPGAAPALDVAIALGPDGRSRLARRRARWPISLGRAYPGGVGEPATLIPQAAGAGLLAGDVLRQRVEVGAGAGLRLVAAGATPVLAPGAGREGAAVSETEVRLGEGALLVLAAEPHVLLPGARLTLSLHAVLPESATLLIFDGICGTEGPPGPWRAETVLTRPGGPVLLEDRQAAGAEALAAAARLPGGWSACGTVLALAPPERRAALAAALPEGPATLAPGALAAAAALRGGIGVGLRIVARDGGALRDAARAALTRAGEALDLPRDRSGAGSPA
jgi:urease accessory protein